MAHTGYEVMLGILAKKGATLRSDIEEIRLKFQQSGDKGASAEFVLREFLRLYLPQDQRVGHGEVFNLDGERSTQTDIVIANRYHVSLERDDETPQAFIIEAVDVAGEVKMRINGLDDLRDCFDKARQFKKIFADDVGALLMAFGGGDGKTNRYFMRRPYFAFAYETRMNETTILNSLRSWESELPDNERPSLDALFLLDKVAMFNSWEHDIGLRVSAQKGGPNVGLWMTTGFGEKVLADFLTFIYYAPPEILSRLHPVVSYLTPNNGRYRLMPDRNVTRIHPPQG